MPSKKKKYNARFPAGRIKKIMQTDEEVGKVAQAVPVIISRTLELFVESLLTKSLQITQARNAKTLTPSHMKQCILSESRFDFLKDLVKNIPDPSTQEDSEYNGNDNTHESVPAVSDSLSTSYVADLHDRDAEAFYGQQGTSAERTPVIQYVPKVKQPDLAKINFLVENLVKKQTVETPALHIDLTQVVPTSNPLSAPYAGQSPQATQHPSDDTAHVISANSCKPYDVPSLIPLSYSTVYGQSGGDNSLYIDEDYDN